jgi:hypothetical protein
MALRLMEFFRNAKCPPKGSKLQHGPVLIQEPALSSVH